MICSFRSGTKNNCGDFAWQCSIGSLTASQVTIQRMMVSNIFELSKKYSFHYSKILSDSFKVILENKFFRHTL